MTRKLYGIGTGPGAAENLTIKAIQCMKEASVIFAPNNRGKNMALDTAEAYVDEKEIILLDFPMTATTEKTYREAMSVIDKRLKDGDVGAFLNIGDSTIYSTFKNMVETYTPDNLDIELVPGIPSFVAAANRIQENLVMKGESFLLCEEIKEEVLPYIESIAILKTSKNLEPTLDLLEKYGFHYTYVAKASLPEELILRDREKILSEKNYISLLLGRKEIL